MLSQFAIMKSACNQSLLDQNLVQCLVNVFKIILMNLFNYKSYSKAINLKNSKAINLNLPKY